MPHSWDSKDEDLELAKLIMLGHRDEDAQKAMGIREYSITQEGTMTISQSQWVVDLQDSLIKKHGEAKGLVIADRIMSDLVIRDHLTH